MSGVFTDESLERMLNATDIKMDMILPFVGALIDRTCAEAHSCTLKTVFKECVNVMNKVCGNNGQEKWSESRVRH